MTGEIQTAKFGTIEFGDKDVILIPEGLLGFRLLTRFLLVQNPEFEPIQFLQSLEDPLISFPLIDPRLVCPEYSVALNDEFRERLKLTTPELGLAYSIVTLGSTPVEASVNLFAPLVINPSKMLAGQVILMGSDYSVSEPLLRG